MQSRTLGFLWKRREVRGREGRGGVRGGVREERGEGRGER